MPCNFTGPWNYGTCKLMKKHNLCQQQTPLRCHLCVLISLNQFYRRLFCKILFALALQSSKILDRMGGKLQKMSLIQPPKIFFITGRDVPKQSVEYLVETLLHAGYSRTEILHLFEIWVLRMIFEYSYIQSFTALNLHTKCSNMNTSALE